MKRLISMALISLTYSCFLLSSVCIATNRELIRLWLFKPRSPSILVTQVINDVNSDGHEDVFVATLAVTRYSNGQVEELPVEFIFLDGKTGTVILSQSLGQISLRQALYVNDIVVTSDWSGLLKCYDTTLKQIWNKTLSSSPTMILYCSPSKLVLAIDKNVTAISIEDGVFLWTWVAPTKILSVLAVMDRIILLLYR